MASAGFSFPKVLLIILDLSAQYNVDFGACFGVLILHHFLRFVVIDLHIALFIIHFN